MPQSLTVLRSIAVSIKYRVSHDMPKCIPPELNENADFVYLRFHGEKGDYRGSYSIRHLENKANEIRGWLHQGKDVYSYFNNTIGGASSNLQTLIGPLKNPDDTSYFSTISLYS